MKHTPRDLVTVLMVFGSLLLAGFLSWLASPVLFNWLGQMALLALVAGFCLIYGLGVLGYLRLVGRIFPLRPGVYTMQHAQTWLWKHQAILRNMAEAMLRPAFPLFLKAQFYALQGATVGRDVAISGTLEDPMLTTLGDHAIVGKNATLTAHTLVFDQLSLDPISIGRGATVGINAVIMPGVEVGDYSVVAAGSVVPPGTKIPAGELWGGVPARQIKALKLATTTVPESGLLPGNLPASA